MNTLTTSVSQPKNCVIIGAGIAGLSAALALEQVGFSVVILEKAESLTEIGAGLQLSPNATAILEKLDVLPALKTSACRIRTVDLNCARNGKTLLSLQTKAFDFEEAPFLSVHRADLQGALLHQVGLKPSIEIRLGTAFVERKLSDENITVSFRTGTNNFSIQAQCLIGADGVHSNLRQSSGGLAARASGYIALRQTVDANALQAVQLRQSDCVQAFLAPNAHLVAYPVSQGKKVNLVYICRQKEMTQDAPTFDGFTPPLRQELGSIKGWTSWPIHTLVSNTLWRVDERSILIGDAAHAMLPFAAQGASMAIEDGYTLAACLHGSQTNVAVALQFYEKLRRKRISRVMNRTKFNALAYHAWGPLAVARNMMFATKGQGLMDQLEWLYAYRVTGLT